jgi:hypothetical protein
MLVRVENKSTETAVTALTEKVQTLPDGLATKSLGD